MLQRPLFIGNEIYRRSSYGQKHPLAIPRVSTAMDLSRAMGWLPDEAFVESRMAAPEEIARFHDRDYVDVVRRAEAERTLPPDLKDRHNIGKFENPIFPEVYSRPATSSGAALMAADLVLGGGTVYSPAGGTHHGRRDRASGFCYFNDPVLAILRLLDRGLGRVYYVDLDAHHGDGVQDAFAEDDRVLTVSVHQEGLWPRTGPVEDRAGGMARNLPVPPGFNDSELDYVVEHALLPLGEAFRPDAVVIQSGADALADDPMSRLDLSNRALWDAVAALLPLAPRRLVLGGGGYNPWSVGRAWAGVWATIAGHDPDVPPTPEAEAVLRALSWSRRQGQNPPERWFTTIADPPNPGPVRREIRDRVAAVRAP
jgi:acetoin utilization protein AcuC